jgi:periodic tryptophan protein 1
MITSISWIPRGAARQRPIRYELTPEEYQRVRSLAKKETDDQDADTDARTRMNQVDVAVEEEDDEEEGSDVDITDLPDALNMGDYDDEGGGGLVKYDDDDDDDLFDFKQQGDNVILDEGDSDEEDAEDNEVRPTDSLLAVAITEDEYSHLEIQLLSDDGNLYVHHDIALPDFPLCLAWTDCPPFLASDNSQVTIGNFMAVGTFNPVIEIWNLDVLDPLEPTATLGRHTLLIMP